MIGAGRTWSPDSMRGGSARPNRWPPLVVAAAIFSIGIVLERWTGTAPLWSWLIAVALLLVGWWRCWKREQFALAEVALGGAILALGGAVHHAHWRLYPATEIGRFARIEQEPICLEAIALGAPVTWGAPAPTPLRAIPQGPSSSVALSVVSLRNKERWRPASGRCELQVNGQMTPIAAGDRVRIFAQFSQPLPALNPEERDAQLAGRMDRQLVRLRCESPECLSAIDGNPSPLSWRRKRDELRSWVDATLVDKVGPAQGGLAMAMVTGSPQLLSDETTEAFRRTGALHVLVVSGMQVSMVVGLLYVVLRMGWAPRLLAAMGIMLLAVIYAAITGNAPPVQRAMIAALLICIAGVSGRTALAANSLGAAALVVLALNPSDLFQNGTQLSFMATAALVWLGLREIRRQPLDPLARLIAECAPWWRRGIGHMMTASRLTIFATLLVSLVSAPLLASQFHLLSPISIATSPVLLPLVAVVTFSGLAAVVLSWMPGVGDASGAVCRWSSAGVEQVVNWSDSAPGASFFTAGPALWWVLGFYLLLVAAVAFPNRRRYLPHVAIAWLIVGLVPALARQLPREELRCTFISVGHGLSVLIEAPNGANLLYDAGAISGPEQATEHISAVLWSRGIRRLDGVIVSHADIDHYNALPGLLERFTIGRVYVSPNMAPRLRDRGVTGPGVLQAALTSHGVPVSELSLGDRLNLGSAQLEVLHPQRNDIFLIDNAGSLVVAIEYAGRRVLLTGDLQSPGLEALLDQERLACEVLLAPHHGSALSNPPGLAAWCGAKGVVLSCGLADRVSEVETGYYQRRIRPLATARQGAISATLSPNKCVLAAYRRERFRPVLAPERELEPSKPPRTAEK
jgi:competence protein ComEC